LPLPLSPSSPLASLLCRAFAPNSGLSFATTKLSICIYLPNLTSYMQEKHRYLACSVLTSLSTRSQYYDKSVVPNPSAFPPQIQLSPTLQQGRRSQASRRFHWLVSAVPSQKERQSAACERLLASS